MAIPIPITNGFYESESLPLSAQRCVNFRPNIPQAPALSDENLFGTEGIEQIAYTGLEDQQNRGSHTMNGIPYFVNGNTLYSLDRSLGAQGAEIFSFTALGTVEGSGRVSMDENGTQLMILVPGDKGYIYNPDDMTPFQEITDPDFTANGQPQYMVFIDGYFVCTTDSKKWIISGINDGLSWDALDFGSAESDPDSVVAPVSFRNQLFITGTETTEAFQNQPTGAGFPFIRSNIFLEKGCSAPFSLISANNTFMMIGAGENESPAIYEFAGGNFQKISTTAIDTILAKQTDEEIAQAFSYSFALKGAFIVGFTFDNETFEFNVVTRRWNERKSVINNLDIRWRVNSIVAGYGHLLVFDAIDGRVGIMDSEYYTEYDENIRRFITTQPFSNQGDALNVSMVELTVESGVGNADRPDPVVSMAVSRNGKTFDYQRTRPIGRVGEYDQRVIWTRLGQFGRFAVLRFSLSDPVKPVFIKCEAEAA